MLDLNLNGVDVNDSVESDKAPKGAFVKVLPTDVYDAVVKIVYFTKASSGVITANVMLTIDGYDRTFPLYITYKDTGTFTKREGNKTTVIRGYQQLNSLAICAVGTPVAKVTQEKRTVEIYNFDVKANVPTSVEALIGLMGKTVKVGIKAVKKNKRELQNNLWVDTTVTEEKNELDKFYRATDFKTTSEIMNNTDAIYGPNWVENNKDKVFETLSKNPVPPLKPMTQPAGVEGRTADSLFADDD